jgi:acyl-coenzyme A synthetase/AMP-(fatty) acid ligase/acyl carrier protein
VPDDALTLFASYGFDAAVMDIFGALLTGACLLPIEVRTSEEPELAEALARATVLHATPTVFRHLAASLPGADLRRTRAVVLGGEPATRQDADLFRRRCPGAVLVNGLGPTESTLALQYVLDAATEVRGPLVPVGFPVPDTEVTLVNADGRAVGTLAVGEIAIRSEHVALGYWNDEAETARAFGPGDAGRTARTPAARTPAARTYLSGDLARRDRHGVIEFVGRRDAQVKIRGVRVEPAEIERRLLEYPGISAAAVVPQPHADGVRLAAYVVCDREARPDRAALRPFLREGLPEAMVPAAFVALDRLPMTVNGKIDRAALPAPSAENALPTSAGPSLDPATPVERQVASIWCEVLGRPAVDRRANFFELGGHSLLATQVISRLRSVLGRAVPLRALFEAPTVEALSRVVEEAAIEAAPAGPADPPRTRLSRERHRVRLT